LFEVGLDLDFVYSDEPEIFNMARNTIFILEESISTGGFISSTHEWIPLTTLLMRLPWRSNEMSHVEANSEKVRRRGGIEDALPGFLEMHVPEYSEWCLQDSIENDLISDKTSSSSSASFDHDDSSKPAPFHDEDIVIDMAMADARARFKHLTPALHFTIDVRGGLDTYRKFGVAADYLRSEAVSGLATQFCDTYHLNKSFSCKLDGAMYSDACAGTLCESWANKMQTMYDTWRRSGFAIGFVFQPCDLGWIESVPFTDLAAGAPPQLLTRLRAIRNIKPCL
jgi:hypothetical protein